MEILKNTERNKKYRKCIILSVILYVIILMVSVKIIRVRQGETVTFSLLDTADRKFGFYYYDNKNNDYPFSIGSVSVKHEGTDTIDELIFKIPYGRSNKIRLDLYQNVPNEVETVYLYQIKVELFGREKILDAEGIKQYFHQWPDGQTVLEDGRVVISFNADMILFEALNDIGYTTDRLVMDGEVAALLISILILVLGVDFLVLVFPSLSKRMSTKEKGIVFAVGYSVLFSFALTVGVTFIQFKDIGSVFLWIRQQPYYTFITMMMILLLFCILYDILGLVVSSGIVMTITIMITVVNEFKLKYRGTPFSPVDLTLIKEVDSILEGLDLTVESQMIVVIAGAVGIVVISYVLQKKYKEACGLERHIGKWTIVKIGIASLFAYTVFIGNNSIASSGFDPEGDYAQKGVLVGFASNIKTLIPPEVEGYTKDVIDNIEKEIQAGSDSSDVTPNIIMIMSESFWDIEEIPGIAYDRDLFPNLKKLREESIYGQILTSVYGGGTSITEFEALTGFTKQFIPMETTPYYQIKNITHMATFSVAQYLRNEGYETIAMHPFVGENYNRHVVYPNMGFNTYITYLDFKDAEIKRSFISDKSMTDKIIELYEDHVEKNENPIFEFIVSVQNHPDYSESRWEQEELISVETEGLSASAVSGIRDLATGLNESDAALGYLTDYLRTRDEPTIVIFFGDHMSKVGDLVYEIFEDSGMITSDMASYEKQYIEHRTPFIIWSNYKTESNNVGVISSSFLLPTAFEYYGLSRPLWFDFLNQVKAVCPGNSLNVVLHTDGTYSSQMNDLEAEWYEKYKLLQYDYLYGKKWAADIWGSVSAAQN